MISTVNKTKQGKGKNDNEGDRDISQRVTEVTFELDLYERKRVRGDLGRENSKCNSPEVGLSFAIHGKKSNVDEEGGRKEEEIGMGCTGSDHEVKQRRSEP